MHRKNTEKTEKNIVLTSSNFDQDPEYKELKKLYTSIKRKYKLTATDVISRLEEKEVLIPSCVFNEKLSVFESMVKYLKENLSLANREIAVLTFKSQKSIWQSYNSTKKKFPSLFEIKPSVCHIPVSILKEPFTILEAVVKYLKEDLKLSFHKIAVVLRRDDRTIWTVYDRVKRK